MDSRIAADSTIAVAVATRIAAVFRTVAGSRIAADRAAVAGHLTPNLLEESLNDFKDLKGDIPKIIGAHMNPAWEATVRRELAEVEQRLGLDIQISEADMVLVI